MSDPGAGLVDAPAAAAFLSATGAKVTAGQIRNWAYRGLVGRYGKDRRGRTLYRLTELEARSRHAERERA